VLVLEVFEEYIGCPQYPSEIHTYTQIIIKE